MTEHTNTGSPRKQSGRLPCSRCTLEKFLFEVEVDDVRFHPTFDFSPDQEYLYCEDGNGVVGRMHIYMDQNDRHGGRASRATHD